MKLGETFKERTEKRRTFSVNKVLGERVLELDVGVVGNGVRGLDDGGELEHRQLALEAGQQGDRVKAEGVWATSSE